MWNFGDTITRREVMGFSPIGDGDSSAPWFDKAWIEQQVRVIEHSEDRLAIYVEPDSPHTFPPGVWPGGAEHPWKSRGRWEGIGCLMTQDPRDHHAVWHFWNGPERNFVCWYINLQTAPRLYGNTMDTQDLEVDLVVWPDGTWEMKDWDLLDVRVSEGRFSTELGSWIRTLATSLGDRLDRKDYWWDLSLAAWEPPEELSHQ
ncbi:MAG: DUF402 domain-containing protein [Actinobacteria bacterium]|nr:DUF402 domain-containing protein [Actinomycetota bacterium]